MTSNIVFVTFNSSSARVKETFHNICEEFAFDVDAEAVQKMGDPLNINKFIEETFVPLRIKTRYYVADVSLCIHNALSEVKLLQKIMPEAVIVVSEIFSFNNAATLLQNLNRYVVPFLTPDVPCIRSLVVIVENDQDGLKDIDMIECSRDKLLQWSINYHFELIFPFQPENQCFEKQYFSTSNKSPDWMKPLINFLHCHTWKSMIYLNQSSKTLKKKRDENLNDAHETRCVVDDKVFKKIVKKDQIPGDTVDDFDSLFTLLRETRERAISGSTSDIERREAAEKTITKLLQTVASSDIIH